jgi:hypothetical protein
MINVLMSAIRPQGRLAVQSKSSRPEQSREMPPVNLGLVWPIIGRNGQIHQAAIQPGLAFWETPAPAGFSDGN